MNDRFVTLLGALAALFVAGGLLLSRGSGGIESASRPTSKDSGDDGLAGAARWLQQSGVAVLALRARYTELPELSRARGGNLLVVAEPMVYAPRTSELRILRSWVQRGNDVLLLESPAALSAGAPANRAAPANRVATGTSALLAALDLSTTALPKEPDAVCGDTTPAPDADRAAAAVVLKPHPSDVDALPVIGVREVRIKPEAGAARPAPTQGIGYAQGRDRVTFEWLCDMARGRNALWQFRLGRGRVWVLDAPQLFANRNLALADDARLLANLVGVSVVADGATAASAVIFDDMHQGDSTLYDPAAFFRDPRLHASLWLLLALWLLYLLGYSNRFAPPPPPRLGVTPAQFAEGVGGFFARHLGGAAGANALLGNLHTELARRQGRSPSTSTLWDLLAAMATIDPQLITRLRAAETHLRSRRGRDLRPLARLIHQIREQLK